MTPQPPGSPIVDLAPLSKPVEKLIEVVAQGIGGVYKPVGTVLQARADSKAKMILAAGEIQVSELYRRMAERLIYTEIERQKNLEEIVSKAPASLPAHVSDKPVDKDWITHFFGAAQDVSDGDMQTLWARILAGEVAHPGSTTRRTLEFLKTLSKAEAEMIGAVASVSFVDHTGWSLLVEETITAKTLNELFGGRDVWRHMIDIGIVATEPISIPASKVGFLRFTYGALSYKLTGPPPPGTTSSGLALMEQYLLIRRLSVIGNELFKVVDPTPRDGFIDKLSAELQKEIKVRIDPDTGNPQSQSANDGATP